MSPSPSRPQGSLAERVFAWIARLFPRDFRDEFGDEMGAVFRQDHRRLQTGDAREGRGRFWGRTVLGVLRSAPRAHLDGLGLDLRYSVRSLARQPLFVLVAVASLALGIAGTTTVVALFQATFLRTIPGATVADRLVNVKLISVETGESEFASYPNYIDLRQETGALAELAGFHGLQASLKLTANSDPELGALQVVSSNYFSTLGVRPASGRFFLLEEERERAPVAVVSSLFAEQRLGVEPLGQELWINGSPVTVVGVAEGFRGHFIGFDFDLFLPMSMSDVAGLPGFRDRSAQWIELVGRLGEGETVDSLTADLEVQVQRLVAEHGVVNRGLGVTAERCTGIDADLRGGLLAFLITLGAVNAFVLLIACLNVAGMMLSRAAERGREMAVRQALGASRSRLHRQLITESLLLALGAGVVGAALAFAATRVAGQAFAAIDTRINLGIAVDGRTLLASLVLSLLVAFASGLAPALLAGKTHLVAGLRASAGTVSAGARLRSALVVGQVALSLVILVSALLFLRALQRAADLDPGFEAVGVYAAAADPDLVQMPDDDARAFLDQLEKKAAAIPGASAVALVNRVPLSLGARIFASPVLLEIPGHEPPPDQRGFNIEHAVVSEGYFDTLQIPLRTGRVFREGDRNGPKVAVVNEVFAQRFFDGDALGRTVRLEDTVRLEETMRLEESAGSPVAGSVEGSLAGNVASKAWSDLEIVGVAANSRYRSLDEADQPFVYLSFHQRGRTGGTLLVRGSGDPASLAAPVRAAFRELAPNLAVADAAVLEERLEVALLPQRVAAIITVVLGAAGLFLAAVGLYGVLGYGVQRRSREIGLRASLGASPRDLIELVLRQSAWLVGLGAVIGLPAALLASRFLSSFLYGLSPADPWSYGVVVLVLGLVAAVASLVPARRAARIDPILVLRGD